MLRIQNVPHLCQGCYICFAVDTVYMAQTLVKRTQLHIPRFRRHPNQMCKIKLGCMYYYKNL